MLWKAEDHYTPQQIEDMKKLVDINARRKEIEKSEKDIKDRVKKYMEDNKNDEVVLPNGDIITITSGTRTTVVKKTKDEFIAKLIGLGKQYLVVTSVEPDVESVFAEVDAGNLDKALVDKYIKVSETRTLNIK